jgi:hypothetical protein
MLMKYGKILIVLAIIGGVYVAADIAMKRAKCSIV